MGEIYICGGFFKKNWWWCKLTSCCITLHHHLPKTASQTSRIPYPMLHALIYCTTTQLVERRRRSCTKMWDGSGERGVRDFSPGGGIVLPCNHKKKNSKRRLLRFHLTLAISPPTLFFLGRWQNTGDWLCIRYAKRVEFWIKWGIVVQSSCRTSSVVVYTHVRSSDRGSHVE